MGALCSWLGFVLLAAWAGLVFGWPASLLVAGVELLVIGLALSDVRVPSLRRRGNR